MKNKCSAGTFLEVGGMQLVEDCMQFTTLENNSNLLQYSISVGKYLRLWLLYRAAKVLRSHLMCEE